MTNIEMFSTVWNAKIADKVENMESGQLYSTMVTLGNSRPDVNSKCVTW